MYIICANLARVGSWSILPSSKAIGRQLLARQYRAPARKKPMTEDQVKAALVGEGLVG
jgi:hypothetical protein